MLEIPIRHCEGAITPQRDRATKQFPDYEVFTLGWMNCAMVTLNFSPPVSGQNLDGDTYHSYKVIDKYFIENGSEVITITGN